MAYLSDLLEDLFSKKTKVFALVGESGTGKSFRAKLLAQKYKIQALIDDGLLIQGDKILAGKSAKKENSYMGAVRTALFDSKEHRDSVARVIQKQHIRKILLLGTSEKMVNKIALRLQLPQPEKIIHIEDIATREEIEKAIRSRQVEGKHVIPVCAIEVKKDYPQIFHNSFHIFLKDENKDSPDSKVFEKSVVTPSFSKKERLEISEAALCQMIYSNVKQYSSEIKIKKLIIKTDSHGYRLSLTVDLPFATQLTESVQSLQKNIIDGVENLSGILIEEVNIIIDKITGPLPSEKDSA